MLSSDQTANVLGSGMAVKTWMLSPPSFWLLGEDVDAADQVTARALDAQKVRSHCVAGDGDHAEKHIAGVIHPHLHRGVRGILDDDIEPHTTHLIRGVENYVETVGSSGCQNLVCRGAQDAGIKEKEPGAQGVGRSG